MGWSDWFNDDSGGQVKEKVVESESSKDTHFLRTEDHTRTGDRENHSHVMVRENSSGTKTAHAFHGIEKKK